MAYSIVIQWSIMSYFIESQWNMTYENVSCTGLRNLCNVLLSWWKVCPLKIIKLCINFKVNRISRLTLNKHACPNSIYLLKFFTVFFLYIYYSLKDHQYKSMYIAFFQIGMHFQSCIEMHFHSCVDIVSTVEKHFNCSMISQNVILF